MMGLVLEGLQNWVVANLGGVISSEFLLLLHSDIGSLRSSQVEQTVL